MKTRRTACFFCLLALQFCFRGLSVLSTVLALCSKRLACKNVYSVFCEFREQCAHFAGTCERLRPSTGHWPLTYRWQQIAIHGGLPSASVVEWSSKWKKQSAATTMTAMGASRRNSLTVHRLWTSIFFPRSMISSIHELTLIQILKGKQIRAFSWHTVKHCKTSTHFPKR